MRNGITKIQNMIYEIRGYKVMIVCEGYIPKSPFRGGALGRSKKCTADKVCGYVP
jgi:hypothetical protein